MIGFKSGRGTTSGYQGEKIDLEERRRVWEKEGWCGRKKACVEEKGPRDVAGPERQTMKAAEVKTIQPNSHSRHGVKSTAPIFQLQNKSFICASLFLLSFFYIHPIKTLHHCQYFPRQTRCLPSR